jgi:hypothetical protein
MPIREVEVEFVTVGNYTIISQALSLSPYHGLITYFG